MIERDIAHLVQQCKTLNHLQQIHANLIKLPSSATPAAVTSLLSFTADAALFPCALAVFRSLSRRTTFQYNTMIGGCVQSNHPRSAISCYRDMLRERLIKNNYTFTPLIKACSMDSPDFGRTAGLSIHGHVVKLGFCRDPFIVTALIEFYASNLDMGSAEELFDEIPVRDVVLWTVMIDGYGKTGDVEKARKVFDEMPERNVISWSVVMAAYSQAREYKEVLCLYRRMEDSGLEPNESVLVTALTACANIGALAQGLSIHSYAEKRKDTSNSILGTSLVEMYSKCGRLELALKVFRDIQEKDTAAWNAIISGVAMTGNGTKSFELFENMVFDGIRPNEATFVSVLTACTHSKLVKQGLSLFESMSKVYMIEPKTEHYACVVDLLARSGKLEEAENLIDEKMVETDDVDSNMWGALLGACRVYGDICIGNRVWKKMVDKGVDDYGIQVLVYNMYREAGWNDEANGVREMMEKKQRTKKPGCSAIEVTTGDLLPPRAGGMCGVLDPSLSEVTCTLTCNL